MLLFILKMRGASHVKEDISEKDSTYNINTIAIVMHMMTMQADNTGGNSNFSSVTLESKLLVILQTSSGTKSLPA